MRRWIFRMMCAAVLGGTVPAGYSADNKTVKDFCETRFGIDFPMTGLAHVRGAQAAPFYAWVNSQRLWHPNWNFNKVLIGRDGRVVDWFSAVGGMGAKLDRAIEAALDARN